MQESIVDNPFHPVYFMSKKTSEAKRKYSSYELEDMAVIEAFKKFRIYVLVKFCRLTAVVDRGADCYTKGPG